MLVLKKMMIAKVLFNGLYGLDQVVVHRTLGNIQAGCNLFMLHSRIPAQAENQSFLW